MCRFDAGVCVLACMYALFQQVLITHIYAYLKLNTHIIIYHILAPLSGR